LLCDFLGTKITMWHHCNADNFKMLKPNVVISREWTIIVDRYQYWAYGIEWPVAHHAVDPGGGWRGRSSNGHCNTAAVN